LVPVAAAGLVGVALRALCDAVVAQALVVCLQMSHSSRAYLEQLKPSRSAQAVLVVQRERQTTRVGPLGSLAVTVRLGRQGQQLRPLLAAATADKVVQRRRGRVVRHRMRIHPVRLVRVRRRRAA